MADYDTSRFRRCGKHGTLPVDHFSESYSQRKNGKRYPVFKCKECQAAKKRARYRKDPKPFHEMTNAWRAEHRERAREICNNSHEKYRDKYNAQDRVKRQELRVECLRAYSPSIVCAKCSESYDQFLVLDHIDGGGTAHRREVGHGALFYKWIKKNRFPPGYRVLCHNCNFKEHLRANEASARQYSEEDRYVTYVINGVQHKIDKKKAQSTTKKRRKALRAKCVERYSNGSFQCACCGSNDPETLSIDHIGGGGREHFREIGGSGEVFFKWLVRNSFPPGFRVLCLNCNFAYGAYGACPHALPIPEEHAQIV